MSHLKLVFTAVYAVYLRDAWANSIPYIKALERLSAELV
jgi:hypothetical protein